MLIWFLEMVEKFASQVAGGAQCKLSLNVSLLSRHSVAELLNLHGFWGNATLAEP